ncbi:hypothetical protein FACS1894190_16500 [Spirochaetia bacterium]|nr:hypothetical protein FACS1894190_16500 [Spirochaetia bacterium]
MFHPNEELMKKCIEIAKSSHEKNQYALGALIADERGNIITIKSSNLISSYDPTAHPEIVVIRKAAEMLKSRYLPSCYLYTTLEPCPMCTSAAIWAKMGGIVFGAYQEDAIEFSKNNPSDIFTWRQIKVHANEIIANGSPVINLFPGVLRDECINLFQHTLD